MCRNDRTVGMRNQDEFLAGKVARDDSRYLSTHFLACQGMMCEPRGNRHDFYGEDSNLIVWIVFTTARGV